jgi:preprotein translocase subunit SecY
VNSVRALRVGTLSPIVAALMLAIMVAVIAAVVAMTQAQRKIPVQYAKRVVGRKMYGGQSTHIPLRVNTAGVIPIIFAISLLMFPATIASWFQNGPYAQYAQWVVAFFSPGQHWFASVLYAALIVVFTYFYAAIQVNIPELSDNLKKYGSFIPGIRPGRPTQEYLDRVMTRITFAGAVFLAVIGTVQYYTRQITGVSNFSLIGGTSLLIVVGVALDTMQSLESHLVMRNYEGFIKQAR